MYFERVYDKSLAQASYIIGCQAAGIAAVIDPKRDIDTYLKLADENGMKITHVLETHIHADFLAGTRELAAVTDAEMYLSDEGDENWKYQFPHIGLNHGDVIELGNIKIEVLHTPGHTPEHISFLVTDTPASEAPAMLLTGDFVFVGDVGRPDLLEQAAGIKGTQEVGAEQMYNSLKEFAQMGDYIQVWPGHGAGSACGKSLGAVPMTTVGYEKIRNWAIQMLDDKNAFTRELLADQPEPPKYFAMMKKLNKENRSLVTEVPVIPHLSKEEWGSNKKNAKIIDVRHYRDFAKAYLPGAINILNNASLSTWMGWLVGYDEPFILIAEEEQNEDIARKLMRIGMDQHLGYITPEELLDWESDSLESYTPVEKPEVQRAVDEKSNHIIDVRGASEFKSTHIPHAENVFVGTLPNNLDRVPKDEPVIIHCQSGTRASIAYSILRANGYENIRNYWGGMNDWNA